MVVNLRKASDGIYLISYLDRQKQKVVTERFMATKVIPQVFADGSSQYSFSVLHFNGKKIPDLVSRMEGTHDSLYKLSGGRNLLAYDFALRRAQQLVVFGGKLQNRVPEEIRTTDRKAYYEHPFFDEEEAAQKMLEEIASKKLPGEKDAFLRTKIKEHPQNYPWVYLPDSFVF